MKSILITLIIVLSTSLCFAEDGDKKERSRDGRDRDRGADYRGDRKFDRFRMMSERFKKENPEKYAELEKLREENPEEFRRQLREIFQKKMSEHMKRGRGMGDRHWLHEMKEKNPEKYEELMKLREEDPEAFRKKMVQEFSQRFRERNEKADEARKEIGELLHKYNQTNSEEEKAAIKEKLRVKMEESFDNDLKKRMEMAEKLENHLKEVKTQIEDREAKKDSIIKEKLEYLIQGKFRRDGDRGDKRRDGDRDHKREVERD